MLEDQKNLVLVVDDEPLIIDLLQTVLEEGGFNVTAAGNDGEAIAAIERDRGRDLVGLITDIRLGCKLSGWDIAHRAREMNPHLAVVYITGDSGGEWSANGVPHSTLIIKPFASAQVVVALSSLINRRDSESLP
ncbi:MAG: response regulator [Caulobacteraceae bacterium]|nr:response regulator [Caulobacteraceae bacterium]